MLDEETHDLRQGEEVHYTAKEILILKKSKSCWATGFTDRQFILKATLRI